MASINLALRVLEELVNQERTTMRSNNQIEDITSHLASVIGGAPTGGHATFVDGECFSTGASGDKGWRCFGKTGRYWRADAASGGPGPVSGVADKDGAFIPVPRP